MTTPSGRPGFNAIDRFGITGDDGSVPDLVNRTQEVITGVLKERMKGSPGWNSSTAAVWNNLRRGIPLDHALLEVIVNRLTGGLVTFPTKQDAIMALKRVPGVDDLVELLTGQEDGDLDDLGTWALNIRNFFGNIDFSDPDFDVEEAFQEFVRVVVQPLIKIRDKLRGLIDISWLTNEHQNLVDESGYDDPITVVSPDDPKITHDATDGVPGSTPLGCLRFECDGANHERAGDMIEVAPGWTLEPESAVKWESITATAAANAIRLELQPYSLVGTVATPVGGRVLVGAVASPSGSSGGTGGWATKITGSYAVPSDGSVNRVVLFPRVTGAATAGWVKFDNTKLFATQDIPQEFIKDLLADLQALLNWITTVVEAGLTALGIPLAGDLIDKINDLADEWAMAREQAEQGLSEVADLIHDLLTNPASVLGTLPKNIVDGLESAFDDLIRIFQGNPIVGTDPISTTIKAWWDVFFNGGAKNVVTQDQIAEASGVPPTDADTKIPWVYLPPELTPVALGHPWVELTKAGSQTISSNTVTKLTAWTQAGGFPLTDTSSAFSVPFAGLFHVKIRATWANTPETTMRVILYKNGTQYRMDNRFGDALGSVLGYNEVSEYVPLDVGDNIDFRVFWLGSGSTKDISVTNTYARITYIGATHLTSTPIPTPTVTFDAKGTEGSGGTSPTKVTSHTFGPNANTIVIPISHTWSSPITVTVTDGATNYDIPVLSGPTFIGTYFGFDAYYSLAAAILPTSVRGKTVTVTVTSAAATGAWSFKSLSFNDVAYLGSVRTSSGSGSARLLVPSNAFSQVAGGFGGMDANFSGFNRTLDLQTSFSAGQHWAHVMGHAQGGLEFIASGGKWAGKFIELHP